MPSRRFPTRPLALLCGFGLLVLGVGPRSDEPARNCGCERDWVTVSPVGLRPFNAFKVLDGDHWLALGSDCLQASGDGGRHWRDLFCVAPEEQGRPEARLGTVQARSTDEIRLLQGWSILRHTRDGGQHWERTTFSGKIIGGLLFTSPASGWVFGEVADAADQPDVRGFAMATRDGGASWQETPLGIAADYRWRVEDMAQAPDGTLWMIADLLYQSTDGGKVWQAAAIDRQQWYDQRNLSIGFAGEGVGWIERLPAEDLFLTRDGGQSWGLRTPPAGVRLIDDLLYAGDHALWLAAGNLWCSADFGVTWQRRLAVDADVPVYQIEALPGENALVAAGDTTTILVGRCRR